VGIAVVVGQDGQGCGVAAGAAVVGTLALVYIRRLGVKLHHQVVGFYYMLGNILLSPFVTFILQKPSQT
jgi:drug/metabolite transporter (DMT)-like permease